jgi:hypothetical protein
MPAILGNSQAIWQDAELLLKLGAAKEEVGKSYALLVIHTPAKGDGGSDGSGQGSGFDCFVGC